MQSRSGYSSPEQPKAAQSNPVPRFGFSFSKWLTLSHLGGIPFFDYFLVQFWSSFWVDFGVGLGAKNGSKTSPKLVQKNIKK